jgi:uncharacterized repeat protein (TIGR03803 family)
MYDFCSQVNCSDGISPSSLLQGTNGNLYGITASGGANDGGTVFEVTPTGQLTTLYSFCTQQGCPNGTDPVALIQAKAGTFYGVTAFGGATGNGTVFKITAAGKLTTLHNFCIRRNCTDGENPSSLVEGSDGNFYGTTTQTPGTVFKISPNGALTTIHTFCSLPNCADGSIPIAPMVQANDGNFYGTTLFGSDVGGTIFQITPTGTLTTLYHLCSQSGCPNTGNPVLMQATDGNFYGTTEGDNGLTSYGSGFSLSTGLAAFVDAIPNFGIAGRHVLILGNNLGAARKVTFNGTPAKFGVVNEGLLRATVPAGATTGFIEVTTASGTLSSNVAFQVLQ